MLAFLFAVLLAQPSGAAPPENDAVRRARAWLERQVAGIEARGRELPADAAAFRRRQDSDRRALAGMLGLEPAPPRTALAATTTGVQEAAGFVLERVHFQPVPRLYVAANFYRPAGVAKPAPTILYLCGHSKAMDGPRSLGNKAGYAHHGAWFAREGFCCLVVDTVQLGEFLGEHHGTYSKGRWWWHGRGYTPAGLEAWTAIRALDYLETRPEVDRLRLGVTGRSGGGAYSWWVVALDERVRAAVPVAGIADLRAHVVDRCVEGHCDCMYMANSEQWDFDRVAALAAPRPLLIANSDRDAIFPLDSVLRLHERVRRAYRLLGAEDRLGLQISEGPHVDSQELQVAAFRWLARWLADRKDPVRTVAETPLPRTAARVFGALPGDALDGTIDESFVPAAAPPAIPEDAPAYAAWRAATLARFRAAALRNWPALPAPPPPPTLEQTYRFDTEPGVARTLSFRRGPGTPRRVALRLGDPPAAGAAPPADGVVEAWFQPRAAGDDRWESTPAVLRHLRRCYPLVGRTLEDCQAWDIRQALRVLAAAPDRGGAELVLQAEGTMALIAAVAALDQPAVRMELHAPPAELREGPQFLNATRVLDAPQLVALLLPRPLALSGVEAARWRWFEGARRAAGGSP